MPAACRPCSGACSAERPRSASGVKLGCTHKPPSRVRFRANRTLSQHRRMTEFDRYWRRTRRHVRASIRFSKRGPSSDSPPAQPTLPKDVRHVPTSHLRATQAVPKLTTTLIGIRLIVPNLAHGRLPSKVVPAYKSRQLGAVTMRLVVVVGENQASEFARLLGRRGAGQPEARVRC